MASRVLIDSIQPVVLVGGRSRRFGRDKLREPIEDGCWLVDRPIDALRAVFGPRVAIVGQCDPQIEARADHIIPDLHPGAGPIGGVISALEASGGPVFVLSGDLPAINSATIRVLVDRAADTAPDRHAIIAHSTRPEPCIAVYFACALDSLRQALGSGHHGLIKAIDPGHRAEVRIDPVCAININDQSDLGPAHPASPSGVCGKHDER